MKDFIDYVFSGDEQDELAKTKAELSYALHCLEREIAIAQLAQSQLASARKALEEIAEGKEFRAIHLQRIAVAALKDTKS